MRLPSLGGAGAHLEAGVVGLQQVLHLRQRGLGLELVDLEQHRAGPQLRPERVDVGLIGLLCLHHRARGQRLVELVAHVALPAARRAQRQDAPDLVRRRRQRRADLELPPRAVDLRCRREGLRAPRRSRAEGRERLSLKLRRPALRVERDFPSSPSGAPGPFPTDLPPSRPLPLALPLLALALPIPPPPIPRERER